MHRRTLSILALTLACAAALVVAALAAAPPPPNLGNALEAQRKLASERSQDPAVFNDLGNLLILARRPDEAEQAYRRAVELDPKRVSALFNLALLLQQRGEQRQALGLYQQVVAQQPGHAWAHYQIGTIDEARGQREKAIDEYARAFALDPQLTFREVNPHIVGNRLVTEAMLRAYRNDFAVPQAPAVYEDPARIANLLVPPPAAKPDAKSEAKPARPAPAAKPGPPGAQSPTVLRQNDLSGRSTGQAAPQGSVRTPRPGATGMQGNPAGGTRTVPRGLREWQRPEPEVQQPGMVQPQNPPVPAPGQVITPPPGGVYYRPGIQSTGRLELQVRPDRRAARG